MSFAFAKTEMPSSEDALPGRGLAIPVPERHFVLDAPIAPPYPDNMELAMFGMGCFWGAERKFWESAGVFSTSVGYAGGFTPNPLYEEVCSGQTGHNEVVQVVFDPALTSYPEMLRVFWENHDPTQGMRQGNDVGTQYRSAIYTFSDTQKASAHSTRDAFQEVLSSGGYGATTTEIDSAPEYYFAEHYHQQYLAKNPNGYCGMGSTGASLPSS